MRFIPLLLLLAACVKPTSRNPVPSITFKDFKAYKYNGHDTADMVLSYVDGDGDLFVDNTSEGPNIIFTTYSYNAAKKAFIADVYPGTSDTFRISNTIKQPDNGYYKGKSIRGDITLPLSQFRLSDSARIIRFTGFMVDMKQNKSNVFSSPVYTLSF